MQRNAKKWIQKESTDYFLILVMIGRNKMVLPCMYLLYSYTVLKKSQYIQNLNIRSSDLPYLISVLRKNNMKVYLGLVEVIYDIAYNLIISIRPLWSYWDIMIAWSFEMNWLYLARTRRGCIRHFRLNCIFWHLDNYNWIFLFTFTFTSLKSLEDKSLFTLVFLISLFISVKQFTLISATKTEKRKNTTEELTCITINCMSSCYFAFLACSWKIWG